MLLKNLLSSITEQVSKFYCQSNAMLLKIISFLLSYTGGIHNQMSPNVVVYLAFNHFDFGK